MTLVSLNASLGGVVAAHRHSGSSGLYPMSMSEAASQSPQPQSGVEELLQRMCDGDREAAAEFITRYASRVRRRIRGKLGTAMRRLFDSQEILSTIGRQLDLYVRDRRLRASGEGELWSFIFTMANNALVQKARVYRRLQSVEGSDSHIAHRLLERLESAERDGEAGAEIELDRVLQSLSDGLDREILSMWLHGLAHAQIAEEVGMEPPTVRKRWQRIREQLRDSIEAGTV